MAGNTDVQGDPSNLDDPLGLVPLQAEEIDQRVEPLRRRPKQTGILAEGAPRRVREPMGSV
jgi:hypothetical protein